METVERTKRSAVARRWGPLAVGLVVVVLAGGVAYCWSGNTQELPIVDGNAGVAAPGDTITIDLPTSNGCGNQAWELYRNRFGRWQQTHQRMDGPAAPDVWERVDDPILRWPRSEAKFYAGYCYIGAAPTTITIPEDITWSPIAICGEAASPCVEIDIDRS